MTSADQPHAVRCNIRTGVVSSVRRKRERREREIERKRERERDRQTDRQTDRQRESERERESCVKNVSHTGAMSSGDLSGQAMKAWLRPSSDAGRGTVVHGSHDDQGKYSTEPPLSLLCPG